MSVRRGFTLVELMLASSIFVIVIGGTFSAFLGIQRLTRTAVTEAELSVRMRELREKLLFHVAPPHDGCIWSGVLSGARSSGLVVESGRKILMPIAWGYDTVNRQAVEQSIELTPVSNGEVTRFFGNDADRYDDQWSPRWLDPAGYVWLPQSDQLETRALADGHVFYMNLEASANGYVRGERIVVPVFGLTQRTLSGKVFDDAE